MKRSRKKVPAANGQPKELTLVMFLIDDSSSITIADNLTAVLSGYAAFLAEIQKSPGA